MAEDITAELPVGCVAIDNILMVAFHPCTQTHESHANSPWRVVKSPGGDTTSECEALLLLHSRALVNSLHRNLHAQTVEPQGCCPAFYDLTTPVVVGAM